MKIINFFKSKRIWINLIAIALVTVLLILGTLQALKMFSRHGDTIETPDFRGLQMSELDQYTSGDYFEFEVIDSVYDTNEEKGSIIDQDPKPKAKIKKGRKVYLSIVAFHPKKIKMPDLTSLSLRGAERTLDNYGLQIASLEYEPSKYKNAVLGQEYLGKEIKPGEKIEKGSAITIILGRGRKSEKIHVPFLIGLKKNEAIDKIHSSSLNVGRERYYNPADTSDVRVYMQSPKPIKDKKVKMGSPVDLVYRNNRKFDFQSYLQEYKQDSLSNTSTDTTKSEKIK
ncbi:MAG: PASTA domain-containing protein [Bacteroidales bacterium]